MEILPPDEPWAGLTRGEWAARWWQWLWSMPEDVNPNFDTTGERCGYGQSGPVFLLPGAWGFDQPEKREITCVVPEGVAIYVGVSGERARPSSRHHSSGELRMSYASAPQRTQT